MTQINLFSTKQAVLSKAEYMIFFFGNPYKMTVGNFSEAFFKNRNKYSKIENIAIGTFILISTFYTLILYTIPTHLTGVLLSSLGASANLPGLLKIGQKVKDVAEIVFLSGSVPLYGLFYALPKKCIASIPQVIRFLAAKISLLTKFIFYKVLVPLWTHVLKPVMTNIVKLRHNILILSFVK
jgi:hypothetical protein